MSGDYDFGFGELIEALPVLGRLAIIFIILFLISVIGNLVMFFFWLSQHVRWS